MFHPRSEPNIPLESLTPGYISRFFQFLIVKSLRVKLAFNLNYIYHLVLNDSLILYLVAEAENKVSEKFKGHLQFEPGVLTSSLFPVRFFTLHLSCNKNKVQKGFQGDHRCMTVIFHFRISLL